MLLLPAFSYGEWKAVKRRAQACVSRLAAGESIANVIESGGFVDAAASTAHIVMHGPVTGSTEGFYSFAPWLELWDVLFKKRATPTVPEAIEDKIFEDSLETTWGVLGLLCHDNQSWLIKERHARFLSAALRFWPELDALGERYFWAVQPRRLWATANNLQFVLANMGVPTDVLRSELPPEGPSAFLRYARRPN